MKVKGILTFVVSRVGTAASGYLLALGANTELVTQAVAAISAVILISVDLILDRRMKEGD